MLASHDLAEMVGESLWHSASRMKEILRSHPFVLIWESIWFSHFLGMLRHRFVNIHARAGCTPSLASECSVTSISCRCTLTVAFAFTEDMLTALLMPRQLQLTMLGLGVELGPGGPTRVSLARTGPSWARELAVFLPRPPLCCVCASRLRARS